MFLSFSEIICICALKLPCLVLTQRTSPTVLIPSQSLSSRLWLSLLCSSFSPVFSTPYQPFLVTQILVDLNYFWVSSLHTCGHLLYYFYGSSIKDVHKEGRGFGHVRMPDTCGQGRGYSTFRRLQASTLLFQYVLWMLPKYKLLLFIL